MGIAASAVGCGANATNSPQAVSGSRPCTCEPVGRNPTDGTQQLTSGILLKLFISLVARTGIAMSSGVLVRRLRAKTPPAVAAGSAAAAFVAAALGEEQWMHDVGFLQEDAHTKHVQKSHRRSSGGAPFERRQVSVLRLSDRQKSVDQNRCGKFVYACVFDVP